jgi:hypothetical protein
VIEQAVAAMRNVLAPLTAEDVPAQPPDMIGAYPALIVYPQPGQWAFQAHTGEHDRPLFGGDHVIVVEWHMVNADLSEMVRLTTPMADAIPEAIFRAFRVNRIDGTLTKLNAIRCETYGEMTWGSDKTFGVRMLVDATIYDEVSA